MRENQYIRVRIRIARLDPVPPRLWHLVRQDLGQQMRGYFHHSPDIAMDQENVTIYSAGVTPDVARVGLNAPAFAEAVRNMIAEYGLPSTLRSASPFCASLSGSTTPSNKNYAAVLN